MDGRGRAPGCATRSGADPRRRASLRGGARRRRGLGRLGERAAALIAIVALACAGEPASTDAPAETGSDTVDSTPSTDSDDIVPGAPEVAWTPLRARDPAGARCEPQDGGGAVEVVLTVDGVHVDDDRLTAADLTAGAVVQCTAWREVDGVRGPTASASGVVPTPNVLLVIADDLGRGDLAMYGGDIATPSLDRLAAEGVRFDTAYVASPVCTPSRAGLLTGVHPARSGVEFNLGAPTEALDEGRGLPRSIATVAERVKAEGLQTALIGKWHLGLDVAHHPLARGFDHFFGFLAGQRLSLEPEGQVGQLDIWPKDPPAPNWPWDHPAEALQRQGEPVDASPTEHLTDVLVDEAMTVIADDGDDAPWLMVLSLQAPHEPLQAGPTELARLTDPPEDEAIRAYRAVVVGLDHAIGRLLDGLEDAGIADDTLVVFLSDHGCSDYYGYCSNAPYQGGKIRMTEGGLRVPMLARWPGRLEVATTEVAMVSSLDVVPTILDAVGAAPGDLDGTTWLPWLRGDDGVPHDQLVWRLGSVQAIRAGDDKLIGLPDGSTHLFDLATDPGEATNRSATDPSRVQALEAAWEAEAAAWREPRWAPRPVSVPYFGEEVEVPF